MIRRLKGFDLSDDFLNDIRVLFKQLSPAKEPNVSMDKILTALAKPNSHFIVFVDEFGGREAILGMASIHVYDTLSERKAIIENVVVHKKIRGRGIGRKLGEELLRIAKSVRVDQINLTSRRRTAHELYKKLGFEKAKTTPFRMNLGYKVA